MNGSESFIRAANDVFSHGRAVRSLLIVSGDSASSCVKAAYFEVGEELPNLTTFGLEDTAEVVVGLDDSANRMKFGLDELMAVAPESDDPPTEGKIGLDILRDDLDGGLEELPYVCTFGLELPASKSRCDDKDSLRRTVDMTSSRVGSASTASESEDLILLAAL